jgi:hypothetical protein
VPGRHGTKVSEEEFDTRTPGNNPYLVNFHVVPLGETTAPRWQFVYSGNARTALLDCQGAKGYLWGHRGLWSDNSVAMLAALFRMQFPLAEGRAVLPPQRATVPGSPDRQEMNQD